MSSVKHVYLINHCHTDLGFTDHPEALWPFFDDVIVRAMDLIEASADHPDASQFRYTCEVVCIVEHFLEHAPPAQIDRFVAHAAAGRIDIGAMWAHFTPIVDQRRMEWMMGRVQRLRDTYGLSIVSAMNNDVNGLPWTWVDVLLDAGITGFTMGINHHRGGSPQRPRAYRWEGPSGRQLGPSTFWYDAGGAPTRCLDQWPGSCHDTHCGGRWAATVGRKATLFLWTPDAPLVQPGGFNYLRLRDEPPGEEAPSHLVSWAVNNHWEVNHTITQAGPVLLRYTVRVLPGRITGDELQAEAEERARELVWIPYTKYDDVV